MRPPYRFIILIILLALAATATSRVRAFQNQATPGQTKDQNPDQKKDQKKDQPKDQKKDDDGVIRLSTELVQIDLVVTDRDGKPVRDLRREDFELTEDGRAQQITHFAVGTAARPATWLSTAPARPTDAAGAAPAPVEVRGRWIVLAVDDYHLAPENLIRAKAALQRFVNEQLAAGDQVAIASASGTLGLFQQFTSEREILQRAINRLSVQNRSATTAFDIPRITDYQAEMIDLGDPDALELAVQEILRLESPQSILPTGGGGRRGGAGNAGGEGGMSPRERAAQQARTRARMIIAENASYTRVTLMTLEGVIRSLRDLPGRKMVVLLSDGFYLGANSSSQLYDLRRITDAATRAGVVIYSLDARGLVATAPGGDASEPSGFNPTLPGAQARLQSGAIEARRDGLNALARDTGGFPVFNNNDLNLGLRRALDDNESYYVLAWEPASSYRDGRFRKIEVRVSGRPELKVRTRKGYFAPNDKSPDPEKIAEKPKEKEKEKEKKEPKRVERSPEDAARDAQLRRGLAALFPLRAIPISLAADFVNTPDEGSIAVITAHLDAAPLNFQLAGGTHQTALDLVTVIFDERGKSISSTSDRLTFNVKPESLEAWVKHGFNYRKLVPLKPGFYQVRMAVREDGSGQVGSATDWIEVPDFAQKKFVLSSIMLNSSDGQSSSFVGGFEPRPARAGRRFLRDGSIDFLIFIYHARIDKAQSDLVVQSQVFAGSKLIYATPLTRVPSDGVVDPSRIPYAARLSLSSFDPGDYELRVVVIDRLAKASTDRRVNFSVE